jgi:hypothetical protein
MYVILLTCIQKNDDDENSNSSIHSVVNLRGGVEMQVYNLVYVHESPMQAA